MDIEKLKLITRNMELLIDSLKVELYGKKTYSFDDVDYEEDDDIDDEDLYWGDVTT